MARVNLFKHLVKEPAVKPASSFVRQRRPCVQAPAASRELPNMHLLSRKEQRRQRDEITQLPLLPDLPRSAPPMLTSPLARAGFESVQKMITNSGTPSSKGTPKTPSSRRLFGRRMSSEDIDQELEVTLQAVDQLYGRAPEPNQSRAPESADSPRRARSMKKRRSRRGPTATLLESQEEFETVLRTRALVAELQKAKLDCGQCHPTDFHAKHSRVQRKVQKLKDRLECQ